MNENRTDCIVIGYNEMPFPSYERLIRNYGEESEAYRDLRMSFVEVDGARMTYVGLLNHVLAQAHAGNGNGHGDAAALRPFVSGEIPNLAAAYLTNYLRRRGLGATYINLFQEQREELAALLRQGPRAVAITTTFYVLNFPVIEMVEFIRQVNPEVRIIVGGPLIGNHTRNHEGPDLERTLSDIGADIYVVESQGEQTLYDVLQCLRTGGDLAGVPNLIYLRDGELRRTPDAPEMSSLDEWYIDWKDLAGIAMGPTLQTRTARSCAFKCSFCNYPARAGKLSLASLDTIAKELDAMHEQGVENVVFIDDTFNVPLPRFKDICRLMISRNYGFNWFSYFRCSNSDEETVDLMAQSGCRGVFLGIESGSPSILVNMNKRASEEAYRRGIAWLKQRGILTFGSFIIGFPGETEETVDETLDFIVETGLDYYRAQMWYCEPGTPIFDERERFQIEGSGFVWRHATMESFEAINHIERLFLSIRDSQWLPQWSFDFWIIPYLYGRGMTREQLGDFMRGANRLLALQVSSLPPDQQRVLGERELRAMVDGARGWSLRAAGGNR
jgi:radical SAM PhpK family P-methyltransferase